MLACSHGSPSSLLAREVGERRGGVSASLITRINREAIMNSLHPTLAYHLKSESLSVFAEGITLALSRWHALQMAINNEWGGSDSLQKSEKLAAELFCWFSQPNVPLCIDDLEHMLDETMMLSFNADIEDGSIEEVAEELMIMHEDCLHGIYDSVEKLRKSNSKTKTTSQSLEGEVDEDEMKQRLYLKPKNMLSDERMPREAVEVLEHWPIRDNTRRGCKEQKVNRKDPFFDRKCCS